MVYPKVTYVRNVTDIDDKINNAAIENNESIQVLADRFTDAYEEDMLTLGVEPPDVTPRATHHIKEIISMITVLVEKVSPMKMKDTSISHAADPLYGELSRRSLDEMADGARVILHPIKKMLRFRAGSQAVRTNRAGIAPGALALAGILNAQR